MELRIDYAHMMAANVGLEHGLREEDLAALQPALDRVHRELEADVVDGKHQTYGFMDLPQGAQAQVAGLEADAKLFASLADAHVVLGIGGSYLGARMLCDALGHRYHNELDAKRRGGWPRLYFEGNGVDNDSLADLFDRLGDEPVTAHVVSKSGGTLETAVAYRLLRRRCAGKIAALAVTTDRDSRLRGFCEGRGHEHLRVYSVPGNVGGRYSVLSPVGLFPAALMGLDIGRLLKGAAEMAELCRSSRLQLNPAYLYAALQYLSLLGGRPISVMAVWDKALEAFGLWYDQLSAESLAKVEKGRTPLTAVCTRELHSRGQQHQEGSRDKVITNLFVERPRRGSLVVESEPGDEDESAAVAAGNKPTRELRARTDGLFYTVGRKVPELNDAAYRGTDCAYAKAQRPGMTFHLGQIGPETIGALVYLFELATVVEGKLLAIDPLDQPGVQAYKDFLNGLLNKPGGERFRAEYDAMANSRRAYLWSP